MIKSINGWAFNNDRPLTEAFEMAKSAGFDGFEVCLDMNGNSTGKKFIVVLEYFY